jgi:hypothetical protein
VRFSSIFDPLARPATEAAVRRGSSRGGTGVLNRVEYGCSGRGPTVDVGIVGDEEGVGMVRQVRPRSGWQVLGVVLVVVAAVAGLVVFAAMIMFVVALRNMGSNK